MPRYAAYLLVHPERYPSNDPDAIAEQHPDDTLARIGDFDAAYGRMVLAQAARADRRVAILDPMDVECLAEDAAFHDLLDGDLPAGPDGLTALAALAETPGGRAHLRVTVGVPTAGWELHEADSGRVAHTGRDALRGLPAGARVLVGGYARRDCVKRVADTLARHGYRVDVCETTTLPLLAAGIAAYPSAS